ncbi:MAG: hypothetical protein IJW94_00925 [Oscillospiraceae bacterium]|nr:hypothetical protein [Oscillospiraceae bacterium]
MEKKNRYEDILYLPHHVSKTRPAMSIHDRAAQFSPFAALTGYDDVIVETGRLTQSRSELTEGEKLRLDELLQEIRERIERRPLVSFLCFQEDARKVGGAYKTVTANVKKLDEAQKAVILADGTVIGIEEIYDIQIKE